MEKINKQFISCVDNFKGGLAVFLGHHQGIWVFG